jgi:hypothetical protein
MTKKKQRIKYGSRRKVWNGSAKQTTGGIKRKDLYKDKYGNLKTKKSRLSKKKRKKAKKYIKRKSKKVRTKKVMKGGQEQYTDEFIDPIINQDGTIIPGGRDASAPTTTTSIQEGEIIESNIDGYISTTEGHGSVTVSFSEPVGQNDNVSVGQIVETTENPYGIYGIEIGR